MHVAEPPRPLVRLPAWVAAVAVAWWTGAVSWAYLVNTEGPMGDATGWAPIVAVAVTGVAACAVFVAIGAVTRRSRVAGVGCAVVVIAAAWVLAPVVVDRHQSFVDRPDRTATCSGWQFAHYPPDTSDGTELEYCVGVEHPVGG
jgi:hypothetical protein